MNDDDELWVDSADRRTALSALAEHRDEEHLTTAEHERRRGLVRVAQTRADLRALFADLPSPHPLIGEERDAWQASPGSRPVAGTPEGRSNGTGVFLGSGGLIVLGALAAGWWVPAIVLGCLVVVVTVLFGAR
ncbi:DUF1707 SHOCT-like domain-containing protein [Actinophytocola glycyrrhizae]|uniref:DUF1707 domain-containing protein n=1 Tax=Actinophytocola glycyrrhizae TaxID=2044873 RepID=A0ABV9S2N3_9PSEU